MQRGNDLVHRSVQSTVAKRRPSIVCRIVLRLGYLIQNEHDISNRSNYLYQPKKEHGQATALDNTSAYRDKRKCYTMK